MNQRKGKRIRVVIYLIVGPLFILSLAANVYLYQHEKRFVTAQPVEANVLYSAAQVGLARGYLDLESPTRVAYLEAQLTRELVLPALSTTFEKIEALGTYLLSVTEAHEGAPSPAVASMKGLEAFEEMLQGRVNLWSDLIARVYVTLANASGIPSRLVRVADGLHGRSHWFSESYVVEQDRWTFVDLRYRKLYIEDWAGDAVSGAELMAAVGQGQTDALEVALFEGGGVAYRPYAENDASERYYFTPGAALEFPAPNELQHRRLGHIRAYFYAPSKVFTLDWSPFLHWGWVKLGLISAAGIFGSALAGLLISDFRR